MLKISSSVSELTSLNSSLLTSTISSQEDRQWLKSKDNRLVLLDRSTQAICESWGSAKRVFFAELNLHDLMDWKKKHLRAAKFSPYPGSERDWTVTLKKSAPIGEVLAQIKALRPPALKEAFLLDLYENEKLGNDRKNATFRFQYQDPEKTIEHAEVEKQHKQLISGLEEKLKDSCTLENNRQL